jgi:methylmalonyl-CoA/ethylmalonyl-CoA epimerase
MHIKRILHIGIAVAELESGKRLYHNVLGLPVSKEEVYQEDYNLCFLPVKETEIELFSDVNPGGPVAEIIDDLGGEGVHHIAFEVDDIHSAVEELKEQGIPMLDEVPKPGAEGTMIAYLHPSATHGTRIELVEVLKDS